jgi:AcrR family transcriptional regulator
MATTNAPQPAQGKQGATEKIRRGPLAERKRATQQKVFRAAVDSLFEQGFAFTTTLEIVRRANISRGALLKQFPTRAELFAGVLDYLVQRGAEMANELFENYPPGLERAIARAEVAWELYERPEAFALLEIALGARGEPGLVELVAAAGRERERRIVTTIWEDMRIAGAVDERAVKMVFLELISLVQGLHIERLLNGSSSIVEETFQAYREQYAKKLRALVPGM